MNVHWSRAAAGALLLSLPALAQNSECGLRGADTTLTGGVISKKCLDPLSLNGKNVQIPSNVTRIDNTGFALCDSSLQEGGAADIVYVLDQSGSMNISYAWISKDGADTVYLEGTNGCGFVQGDLTGFGTLTIPSGTSVRTIPRINPDKSPANCTSSSGDPFTQRGVAFKEAIEFQAQRAPNSTAGYLGFSGGVLDPVRPLKLNTQANIDALERNIILRYNSGTNYTAPLDSAKRWLLNPAITSNPNKAVIFLSDGRPSPANQNGLAVIESTYAAQRGKMPPVYGILLSKPSADTAILDSISKKTGGKFFLIPPSRPDSLKSVVAKILNILLRQYRPIAAEVTNNSAVPVVTGKAGAADFTPQGDKVWLLNLDKIVPLNPQQENRIKLSTEYVDQTGASKDTSVSFILSTTGQPESANKNLPGTQFSVVCRDLPPPVDPVKVAYIKDANGNGSGDLVVLVFAQPLAALPASLDVYWNDSLAGFKNRVPPKLSFLTASGNKVVLAEFPDAPEPTFPIGLTSAPADKHPIAVLPAGGVFGGQRPPIDDSIGPILLTADIKPYDASTVQEGGEVNLDTVTVTVSEPIRSGGLWNTVLLWSPAVNGKCTDVVHLLPVVPAHNPKVDQGDTRVTVIVAAGTDAPAPQPGDCVFLNTDGTYTDLKRNEPPLRGIPLQGKPRSRNVEFFRGYPPVVGISANRPGFTVINQDPRQGDKLTVYSTKDSLGQYGPAGSYVTLWVPPAGFVPGQPYNPAIPVLTDPSSGNDPGASAPLPPDISTIQVITTGKYIADISIYDNKGNFLRRFEQPFGFKGELNNVNRRVAKGYISYLVWDLKDYRGQKAGQGVYVWKVLFRFDNGKNEVRYTRTGLVRRPGWQVP